MTCELRAQWSFACGLHGEIPGLAAQEAVMSKSSLRTPAQFPIARSRSYVHAAGPKVGIIHTRGALPGSQKYAT